MTARRRRGGAVGAVLVLLATLTVWLGPPAARAAVGPGSVRLSVTDVRPNSPALSNSPSRTLDIYLSLVNTTGQTLKDVTISGGRSDPISSQQRLDEAIAKPKAPTSALFAPFTTTVRTTLTPRSVKEVRFRTRTDIAKDSELCLCADAIYPLYFRAEYTTGAGNTVELSTAQTYVPSFTAPPAKTQVAWVWPLLDRPHRFTSATVFTDDELAAEVSAGGRLNTLLDVAARVADKGVPMTLVTDPEIIDELAVMSAPAGYRVSTATGEVSGAGADAARDWLQRLRDVLSHDQMELDFTTFADPAVESLSHNGLSWTVGLTAAEQTEVISALGTDRLPPSDIVWPANGTLSRSTLGTLVDQQHKIAVLSDKVLPTGTSGKTITDALAPVSTGAGRAIAAVTSTPIQRLVSSVLAPQGKGLAALPQLVAELAIRVETSLDHSHFVVITPPRDLTVANAYVAERTILGTAATSWSQPLALRAAVAKITPVNHGALQSARVRAPALPYAALQAIRNVTDALPKLGSLYGVTPAAIDARNRLELLSTAVQRCESSALLSQPALSESCANRVAGRITAIRAQVSLVPPSVGTYTLASKNSKLPVTITNKAAVDVRVRINVSTRVRGFTAGDDRVRTIPADSTVQLHVTTNVDHPGRYDVEVALSTPDGLAVGRPIDNLTVRSTALGTIGVVITIVAAVVLALALVVRFLRRLTKRQRPGPPKTLDPVPAGAEL